MEWSIHKMDAKERARTTRLVAAVANLIVAIGRDIKNGPPMSGGPTRVDGAASALVEAIDECVIESE